MTIHALCVPPPNKSIARSVWEGIKKLPKQAEVGSQNVDHFGVFFGARSVLHIEGLCLQTDVNSPNVVTVSPRGVGWTPKNEDSSC